MAPTTDFKRSQLRLIKERLAPAASKTLRVYLLDAIAALPSAIAGIGAIKSTSGAGHSVEFFGSGEGAISLEEAAGFYSSLIDLYDDSSSALVSSGIASPTEDQIYLEMLDRLRGVSETFDDYRDIRTGVPS